MQQRLLAGLLLCLFAAAAIALLVHWALGPDPLLIWPLGLMLAAAAAGFLLALRLPSRSKNALVVAVLWVPLLAVGTELVFMAMDEFRARPDAVPAPQWDRRTRAGVIHDLRAAGVPAVPPLGGGTLADLLPDDADDAARAAAQRLYLAGVPNAPTVLCNEVGVWQTYRSDRHGFRNPDEVWDRSGTPVVMIGDSHVLGHCLDEAATFVGRVRAAYPGAIALSGAGGGPLSELASLREFAGPMRPRAVIWFFFEGNDIANVNGEKEDPLLTRYLAPGYRAGTIDDAPRDEPILRAYVEAQLAQTGTAPSPVAGAWAGTRAALRAALRLGVLRRVVGIAPYEPVDAGLLRNILSVAQEEVKSWGGRLYFVYLPTSSRYLYPGYTRYLDYIRLPVTGIARDLGVPVLDMHVAFVATGAPLRLYNQHLSSAGQALVADAILRALKADGL